ncbi:MAG: hypothetical protein Q9195_005175 [Heterodermia aff. obscurata]
MVTVYVGPDSYAFHTYKELLCHDSTFFKAALQGSFKEGNEQTVSLPEDDVETFKIYQTWLHTKKLRYNFDHVEWWLCFAKLWVFADKMGSTSLQNDTIDAICATIRQNDTLPWASPSAVCFIFDNTSTGCPIRKLVLYHAYRTAREPPTHFELEDYHVGFLSRLTSLFLQHTEKCTKWDDSEQLIWWKFDGPRYHIG